MLTRSQIILLKRAQAEAGLSDPEYRQALADVTGLPSICTSKDHRLTDRHLDLLLAYFEAIYQRKLDAGEISPSRSPRPVFGRRDYWQTRNPRGNTSRDRYAAADLGRRILETEAELERLGCSRAYLSGIELRINPYSHWAYLAALRRTLRALLNRRHVHQPA
jgi:hypothetical protein